jgi:acetylornithine deacetylase/succinyl-diaminopimelate desuccinylase-like protein
MKGPVAAMAEAFLMLAESGRDLKGTLKMTAVSDEEQLGPAGTRFLAAVGELNADMAIVGEPTNLEVQIMQRGVMWFDVITRGHTSHGSRPHLGVNAVESMIDLAKAIKDQLSPVLKERIHPLLSSPSISFTKFRGGEKVNVIPDYCIMSGDRRILPGENEEDVVAEIEAVLDGFRKDGYRIEFKVKTLLLPTEIPPEHPIVSTLQKNIERVSGEKGAITGKDAGTDAYVTSGQLNIPTVLFGPGDYRLSHRPNERISLEQLAQAARINFLTLVDLL